MTQADVGFASMRSFREVYRGHFFDRETMRFFRSRLCYGGRIVAGRYFVTSEKACFDDYRRVYHLRRIDARPDGGDGGCGYTINTVGEFGSVRAAVNAAKREQPAAPTRLDERD